jgi:hypothetical protein
MVKKTSKKTLTFRREALVRELRRRRDPNWRKAACLDLEELGNDPEGIDHLAAAIKAVLRSERWQR